MQVSPPVLLLWTAGCSGTSPEGCGVSQPDRHRSSTTCAGSIQTPSLLSPQTLQCLHPKLCSLSLTDVSCEYSGTKRTQGYITHFWIHSLCWMYINLLSLLSSTCTSTLCMEHAHRPSIFKAIYTANILAGFSTNTGNNLSFH